MTNLQKIEIRRSEIRSRLNEILGLEGDKYDDKAKTEERSLQTELSDLEQRHRSAILADGDKGDGKGDGDGEAENRAKEDGEAEEDGEAKETRKLRGKIALASYLGAAVEGRACEGAEREYNSAVGISSHGFPLELLAPDPKPAAEKRATTAVDGEAAQRPWLDRLFAESAAQRLGISMPPVPPGVSSYPVVTAGASAAQRAKGQAAGDTAWTVGVSELKPSRNTVTLTFSEEDILRLPQLEQALRRDLGAALVEGVDKSIFSGDAGATGTDADITGLSTAAGVNDLSLTQANKASASALLLALAGLVDGTHAAQMSDLAVVVSPAAFQLWGGGVAAPAVDTKTILAFLREAGLEQITVRGGLETETTNGKFGAFIALGRGLPGAGVAPIWQSAALIRDPYSGAKSGEVRLTLSTFWAFGLPRASNFARLKFVT